MNNAPKIVGPVVGQGAGEGRKLATPPCEKHWGVWIIPSLPSQAMARDDTKTRFGRRQRSSPFLFLAPLPLSPSPPLAPPSRSSSSSVFLSFSFLLFFPSYFPSAPASSLLHSCSFLALLLLLLLLLLLPPPPLLLFLTPAVPRALTSAPFSLLLFAPPSSSSELLWRWLNRTSSPSCSDSIDRVPPLPPPSSLRHRLSPTRPATNRPTGWSSVMHDPVTFS